MCHRVIRAKVVAAVCGKVAEEEKGWTTRET